MFDKTDTKLSSFINQAQPEDLSEITTQIFNRVSSLDPQQQQQFLQQIQRDPEAKRFLEKVQTY